MRKRRNVILGLAVASWVAIACSTGSGPITQLGDGYESPTNLRENPGSGREQPIGNREGPPNTRETPPPTNENPGNLGGGPGSSSSGGASGNGGSSGGNNSTCPPCDASFTCTGGSKPQTLALKTVNGVCSGDDGVTLDCAGKVAQKGTPIGTWSGSGTNITVIISAGNQSQTLTCTKSTSPPAPTTTTAPTGTGTSTAPAKTCADLLACCNKITVAATKTSCTTTYNAIKASEASCAAAFPTFAASCP